jgi:excinuclease ABC subunit B
MPAPFQIVAPFAPAGDQPRAIDNLVGGFRAGQNRQTLLGGGGAGRTFTTVPS